MEKVAHLDLSNSSRRTTQDTTRYSKGRTKAAGMKGVCVSPITLARANAPSDRETTLTLVLTTGPIKRKVATAPRFSTPSPEGETTSPASPKRLRERLLRIS